ncbi:hypothetical protein [Haladaptatus sp.]|uniref:hypothetical protein n=1 Tax=Haladaptatus sp. TaxID=1973141 RepID=UPI003C58BB74
MNETTTSGESSILDDYDVSVSDLVEHVQTLTDSIGNLEQEVAEKDERIDELEQRVDAREDKADEAKAHRKALVRKTQSSGEHIDELQAHEFEKGPTCSPTTSTKTVSSSNVLEHAKNVAKTNDVMVTRLNYREVATHYGCTYTNDGYRVMEEMAERVPGLSHNGRLSREDISTRNVTGKVSADASKVCQRLAARLSQGALTKID